MRSIKVIHADLAIYLESLEPMMTQDEKFASEYLIASFQTKLIPDDSESLNTETFKKFIRANRSCRSWVFPSDTIVSEVLEIARGELHSRFDAVDVSLESIMSEADLGPGANVLSHETCSYPLKVGLGVSGTVPALRLLWAGNVLYTRNRLGLGPKSIPVNGSNISFVPKTISSSRMIATEPTANMLLQKGISRWFECVLSSYGIRMASQPARNSELARKGSIDGSYSTIDLSSASDTISVELVRYLLPKKVFDFFMVARSPVCNYESRVYPVYCACTMGNGFCSSLQTLVFASLMHAVGMSRPCVFGDDIIVPRHLTHRALRVLVLLGFKLNSQKTFTAENDPLIKGLRRPPGHFRESCGTDYLNGIDVRPVFVRDITEISPQVLHNQLKRWFARLGFPEPEWLTRGYFLDRSPGAGYVPDHFPEESGFWRSLDSFGEPLIEGRVSDTHPLNGTSKPQGWKCLGWRLTICEPIPQTLRFGIINNDGELLDWPQFGPKDYIKDLLKLTGDQLLVAFLRGSIRDCKITYRPAVVRYRIITRFYTSLGNSRYVPFEQL